MATREQIEATYNYMDELWRLSLGDHADITAAFFDGDFRKSLDQAQADKYDWILSSTGFRAGNRVLDIGCGWGGLLLAVRKRGGIGKGLTLSTKQAENCWRAGLDVELCDWKAFDAPARSFDIVTSVGAFEHFCSMEEYRAGKQDEVYSRFFELCHRVRRLMDHYRIVLQKR